ncbi:MAG TPA: permease-like cell division protein FtsX, partial [Usitatibacter sp.]|nr:permease-like cell division protein FtsX [Usitatibacter sp.]
MRHWLRLQVQAAGDALRRLSAQPLAGTFSILVLAMAIALPLIAAVVLRSLAAATAGLDTDAHVNVYLTLDASDEDARRIEEKLRARPEVAGVRFVPRAVALEELKATTHLADLLASLERNPLPHAFTVRMKTTDGERLGAIRAAWSQWPKVDQVVADFEWSQRLGRWVRFGNRALALVGLVLGAAVVFIIGHLIRLQVLTQKPEIELSQLIGATASDVRRPFLYHGVLQGILAGAGAIALAAAIALWLDHELQA